MRKVHLFTIKLQLAKSKEKKSKGPKSISCAKFGNPIQVNKDLNKARQVQACPELGTAPPQLVIIIIIIDICKIKQL